MTDCRVGILRRRACDPQFVICNLLFVIPNEPKASSGEPVVGIEPTTRALRVRCSTTELHRRRFFGVEVIARARRRVKDEALGRPRVTKTGRAKTTPASLREALRAWFSPYPLWLFASVAAI